MPVLSLHGALLSHATVHVKAHDAARKLLRRHMPRVASPKVAVCHTNCTLDLDGV